MLCSLLVTGSDLATDILRRQVMSMDLAKRLYAKMPDVFAKARK